MIINHIKFHALWITSNISEAWWNNGRTRSEKNELFLNISLNSLCLNSEYIESHCFGEGSALANSHDITFSNTGECRRTVNGEVSVSLLKPVVLLDVMQIVSSYNNSSLHLGCNNDTPICVIIRRQLIIIRINIEYILLYSFSQGLNKLRLRSRWEQIY